jgi:hypothetical protein
MQLERVTISTPLELGSPEVEALAHSLGDSIKALELRGCTLLSSFWRPLAQRLPHLRRLTLGFGVETSVGDLRFFLGMRSQASPGSLTIAIKWGALHDMGFTELQGHIAALQLQNVTLLRH